MKVKCNININNVPDYATEGFIVARCNEKYELWFYGCYDTEETAKEVSRTIKGVYFEIAESEDK